MPHTPSPRANTTIAFLLSVGVIATLTGCSEAFYKLEQIFRAQYKPNST
jgi:hypothetical protein